MPVACFIIYYNRDKFYQLHCILGIIITVILVAGWASLAGAAANKSNGYVYGPMSNTAVAKSHSATGIVARFVAVVVCIVGVALGVVNMPKRVRTVVRLAHGVGGVLVSFFGPLVVWNGFVRLQPFLPPIPFFDSTPLFWYSVVLGIGGFVLFQYFRKSQAVEVAKDDQEMTDLETSVPIISIPEALEMMKNNDQHLYVFYGETLVRLPRLKAEFDHPGGLGPIAQLEGKDVSCVFTGTEPFTDEGRQRYHQHSSEAHRILMSFKVGRVVGPLGLPDGSTVMGGPSIDESYGCPMFSIDEEGNSVASFTEKTQLNLSETFPVFKFVFSISDLILTATLNRGMKVRVGFEGVVRTYTIVSFDPLRRRLEFVIKIYENGELTSKLVNLNSGDQVVLSGLSSPPLPVYPSIAYHILLAGGTGIVPIMYYMERCCQGSIVLWSLREPSDVFFLEELGTILTERAKQDDAIKIIIYFTRGDPVESPHELIETRSGRLTFDIIESYVSCDVAAVMSGPKNFVECMHEALVKSKVSSERILCLD
jgi:NAD(P)H-flavin reductase